LNAFLLVNWATKEENSSRIKYQISIANVRSLIAVIVPYVNNEKIGKGKVKADEKPARTKSVPYWYKRSSIPA
jgi:hypothetical protein